MSAILNGRREPPEDFETRVTAALDTLEQAEQAKVADFVGYGYMSGKDRILDFNPTDRWIGKNPGGWAPFKVPAPGKAQSREDFARPRAEQGVRL